jgi:hypothetical protein
MKHTGEESLVSSEPAGSDGEAAPPAEKRQKLGGNGDVGSGDVVAVAMMAGAGAIGKSTSRVSTRSLESFKNKLREEIMVLQTTLTVKQDVLKDLELIGGADR